MECRACRGNGRIRHEFCKGTGRQKGGVLGEWDQGECQGCHGTGYVTCTACGGTGQQGR